MDLTYLLSRRGVGALFDLSKSSFTLGFTYIRQLELETLCQMLLNAGCLLTNCEISNLFVLLLLFLCLSSASGGGCSSNSLSAIEHATCLLGALLFGCLILDGLFVSVSVRFLSGCR